jgi:hypothetical protein
MKIVSLIFVWGPALLGFSLGWRLRYPTDWTGPAVMAPIGALLTCFTFRWGVRRMPSTSASMRPLFAGGMIAGALLGVVIFGMLAFGIIGE